MSTTPPQADEFYVGYLTPAPRGVARHIRGAVAAIAFVCGLVAVLVGAAQGPAGNGVWESKPVTVTGLFSAEPCPMLRLPGEDGKPPRTMLLVGEGKCGALEPSGYCGLLGPGVGSRDDGRSKLLAGLSGQLISVTGTLLSRDGHAMIELAEGDRAVIAAAADPALMSSLTVQPESISVVTLRGVIVDPKCFLGAMKPGEGKAHRACAIRCISGGIPPVLIVAAAGSNRYVLLADQAGHSLRKEVLPFVADLVEVHGQLDRRGDIDVLRCDPASITRR